MLEKEKREIRHLYRTGSEKKALQELYLLTPDELNEIIAGEERHKYKCNGSEDNAVHGKVHLSNTLIR